MKSLVFAAVMFVSAPVHAYDPEKGRCSPDREHKASDCTSGEKCVWHYTLSENGHRWGSWCYKTREQAQRALENARELCETVARIDKTTCPTSYGSVFCRACGGNDERKGCDAAAPSSMIPSELLFEAARGAQDYSTRLPAWEQAFPGSTTPGGMSGGPYAAVGTIVSGYADAMKHATRKHKQLSCLVDDGANKTTDDIANEVGRNVKELEDAFGKMKAAAARLPREGVEQNIRGWTVDGAKIGLWRGTNAEGSKVEEWYSNGQRQGIVRLWWPNGARQFEIPYSAGRQEGWLRHYARNGVLWEEIEYRYGRQTWNQTFWDKDGRGRLLVKREALPDGHFVELIYWPNGSLRSRTPGAWLLNKGRKQKFIQGWSEGYYEGSASQPGPIRWRVEYKIIDDGDGGILNGIYNARYFSRDGSVQLRGWKQMPHAEIDADRRASGE